MRLGIYKYPINPQMITLARLSRGLSLNELKAKAKCKHLNRIELGLTKITDDEMLLISEILDYPIDFFRRYGAFPEGLLGERKICKYNRCAFSYHQYLIMPLSSCILLSFVFICISLGFILGFIIGRNTKK